VVSRAISSMNALKNYSTIVLLSSAQPVVVVHILPVTALRKPVNAWLKSIRKVILTPN